jgi:hypothetical protein
MPDYEKLYYLLFNEISDVIARLQEVQREAERLYIASQEEETPPLPADWDVIKP